MTIIPFLFGGNYMISHHRRREKQSARRRTSVARFPEGLSEAFTVDDVENDRKSSTFQILARDSDDTTIYESSKISVSHQSHQTAAADPMDLAGVSARIHKLYFNSFVVERVIQSETPVTTTRFEIIICDQEDNLVFKTNAPLHNHNLPYNMTSMEADIRALIRGLDEATNLGINHISIYSRPRNPILEYLWGTIDPSEKKIALLMDDVERIRKRFRSSTAVMMFEEDVHFFSRVAATETCIICFDEIHPHVMFSSCEYGHRFCLTCAKSHIKVKLLDRKIPDCPQHRCTSQLSLVRFRGILTEKQSLMWTQVIRENSIPHSQRFYCPYQRCSYLMSKTELSFSSTLSGRRRCFKCGGEFCIHCKVPWHSELTCTHYKILRTQNDDAKLNSLANRNRWRQCGNCQQMVERSSGCNRMVCRCGNSFCYNCGSSWISSYDHTYYCISWYVDDGRIWRLLLTRNFVVFVMASLVSLVLYNLGFV